MWAAAPHGSRIECGELRKNTAFGNRNNVLGITASEKNKFQGGATDPALRDTQNASANREFKKKSP
jgi:hypothetical protein